MFTVDEESAGVFVYGVLDIPEGVEEIDNIGEWTSFLTKVYIPKSVRRINGNVFSLCKSLEKIRVDEDNPYFKSVDGILYNKKMTKLICCPSSYIRQETIVVPDTVTRIIQEAFLDCRFIKKVYLPNSVRTIGKAAFSDCAELEEIRLSDKLRTIGGSAFSDCTKLQTISIPNGVKIIKSCTFYGCANLSSVELPEGLKTIYSFAFAKCGILKSIYIPSSVEYIDNGTVFMESNALREVIVSPNNRHYCSEDDILYSKDRSEILCVFFDGQSFNVRKFVKKIKEYALYNMRKLERIYLRSGIEFISEEAFFDKERIEIYCEKDSYAHKYAEKNNIRYKFFPSVAYKNSEIYDIE